MPPSAVLLDANLLVLLIVGLASPDYISRHKRLRAFTIEDFELLRELLTSAQRVIVTPNIVTETSNLASQIPEPAGSRILTVLRALLASTIEVYVPSHSAAAGEAYLRLGITDAATLAVTTDDLTILTTDLDLYLESGRIGRAAINFVHHIAANR